MSTGWLWFWLWLSGAIAGVGACILWALWPAEGLRALRRRKR